MPRKVDPHWGEDGATDVELLSISTNDAAKLAAFLGIAAEPQQIEAIRLWVNEIGTTFRNGYRRCASAFTRAEARRALEEILQLPRLNHAVLGRLNERAYENVYDVLLMMSPVPIEPGDTVYLAMTEDRIDEDTLRRAVATALDELKATKGPDREGEIEWAVSELCGLYEKLTVQTATHSNKGELMAYESGSRSKAGRFVTMCFEHIEPQVRDTQISRGMRFYIANRYNS